MFDHPISTRLRSAALGGVLAAGLAAGAGAAQNPPPINQEQHINHSLVSAAVGALILQKCSSIKPRYFVIASKVNALERYALGLGYTEDQIDAFLDDKDERKRVRREANAYLRDLGVVKENPESYCVAGRSEIAKKTLTGEMIWSWK